MTGLEKYTKLKKVINSITNKYDVYVVNIIRNIQGTLDIELDHNIYYKAQERMVNEIRERISNINDIFYREVV